ncbi:hypothetical protein AGMMS50293_27040 [Spirochaetia bacterium]|nr:hypothetical protein AGMMS50293_27040 [Spirochaetia bacterium]
MDIISGQGQGQGQGQGRGLALLTPIFIHLLQQRTIVRAVIGVIIQTSIE